MEHRQLLALATVARTASFTRAADELSLTQSAVTRQVASLEAETRSKLFDRMGRSVVLTSEGQALLRYALEILRLDGEALDALRDVRAGVGGKLAVGSSSTAAAYLLPPLLHLFRQDRPHVDLSVLTGPSTRVAEMVANNEVDVGVLMDEANVTGLKSVKVAEYSIALVVYAGHPLIERLHKEPSRLSLKEVSELPLILMQKGASLRRSADDILGSISPGQKAAMELDNVEAIKKMIEARLGVSLLPIMSVKNEIASGSLVALPIDAPKASRPSIVVVHREDKYINGAMKAFIELVGKHVNRTADTV